MPNQAAKPDLGLLDERDHTTERPVFKPHRLAAHDTATSRQADDANERMVIMVKMVYRTQ